MSFASRLTHTVAIERPGTVDPDNVDDYGHAIVTTPTTVTVQAAIQPRTAREVALISQAGGAISDHVIFLLPIDVTTSDSIIHDASICPVQSDLPDMRFDIQAVPNAAGIGHHLELEAHLVSGVGEAVGS